MNASLPGLVIAATLALAGSVSAQKPLAVYNGAGKTTTSSTTYSITPTITVYAAGVFVGGGSTANKKAGTPVAYTGDGTWKVLARSGTATTFQLIRAGGTNGVWLKASLGGFVTVQLLSLDIGSVLTIDAAKRTIVLKGSVSKPYRTAVNSVIRF